MTRVDIVRYIDALYWVYFVLIFARVIFSWIGLPSRRSLVVVFRFIYDVTEPYLGIFRRFVPVAGGIDFSPFVAIIVLSILRRIIVGLVLSL
ncbi:MAG: YggT family protein [Thermoleophilia bacterium]|nr:YggT family protein [Thermoleophilia bacterium]